MTPGKDDLSTKAAGAHEQAGQQARERGDRSLASEHLSKAGAYWVKASKLADAVRCFVAGDSLGSSVPTLLNAFDAHDVAKEIHAHLPGSSEYALCVIAAIGSSGEVGSHSAADMLLKLASAVPIDEARKVLKGAALAASWERRPDAALSIAGALASALSSDSLSQSWTDDPTLILDQITALQAQVTLSKDLALLPVIDRLQMRYAAIRHASPLSEEFVRTLFPMFLARGQELDQLFGLAEETPGLRPYVAAYLVVDHKAGEADFGHIVGRFEEHLLSLEDQPGSDRRLTDWDDVTSRFHDARFFMPEALSALIMRHQYDEHTTRLTALADILEAATDEFLKREFEQALAQFLAATDSSAFESLPVESQQGALENAAHAAFELEKWPVLYDLCAKLETQYSTENAVQRILES